MGKIGGAPHQSASDGLVDWRLVACGPVIRQQRSRAGVSEIGVPVEVDGQVGRGGTRGARG